MAKKKPQQKSAIDLVLEAKNQSQEVKIARAVDEARSYKTRYLQALAREKDLTTQNNILLGIANTTSRNRRYRKQPKSKGRGVAAYVLASDWHVEETVEPELVSWKNEFNLEIAWERIERFFQKIVELIMVQNHLAPVDEIWLALLGDLMSGYIHEELKESNELSPVETIVWLREAIRAGIDFLLSETKLPIYIPTCHGNHGRTTPKKMIKTSYKNSYEWLLYTILAGDYEDNERVNFIVGKGYHNTVTCMGRTCRNHHGDGLRYQGGVGGITIPVNKSVAKWNGVSAVDFDFFGHWHTFLWNYSTWVSNGSLIGYSPYAVEIKADFQHPTQSFCVIDSAYGLTDAKPIFTTKAHRK
jgi:hypothetical protein